MNCTRCNHPPSDHGEHGGICHHFGHNNHPCHCGWYQAPVSDDERFQSELQAWLMRADANNAMAWTFLEWMALHGSSVSLSWGDDPDVWEAAWISGGHRYMGTGITALDAMKALVRKTRTENRE